MNFSKFCAFALISFFAISMVILNTTNAQDTQFINYVINPDGTIEPDDSAIIRNGNNYALAQNISGTVTIQKDDAVFDGAGYTVKGNAVKGLYNLDDSVLYLDAGFNLTKAWNVTVQNVRVENCVNGIALVNAYYCRILNCTIIDNAVDGMKIAWSSNNSIFWNKIISNSDDAIQLINSQSNNIMVNQLTSGTAYRSNGNGIQLNGNCSNNKIKGNIIDSFDTGIYFDTSNGNATNNIVSYNNITDNKWNGAFISGEGNLITHNNFYDNGMLSEGYNNCSGNYWNPTPSIFDDSPLSDPVNIDITPEFVEIPQTEPTPTPTDTPSHGGQTTSSTTKPQNTVTPTAAPTETTDPIALPTATPSIEPVQSSGNLPILLIVSAIVGIAAVVFVPLVLKGRVKSADKKL